MEELEADFVVVGGGPSGCFLTRLLHRAYPERSILVVNNAGKPPYFPSRLYFVNLISLVPPFSSLFPQIRYPETAQTKRPASGRDRSRGTGSPTKVSFIPKFANCGYLGGSANINGGIAVVPSKRDVVSCLGESFLKHREAFLHSGWIDGLSEETPEDAGLQRLAEDLLSFKAEASGIVEEETLRSDSLFSGGKIRVFTKKRETQWRWLERLRILKERLHPVDLLPCDENVRVVVGEVHKIHFKQGQGSRGSRETELVACSVDVRVSSEQASPVLRLLWAVFQVRLLLNVLGSIWSWTTSMMHKTEHKTVSIEKLLSNKTVKAKQKVFLCCGAIETPKLLIRSGYGPKDKISHFISQSTIGGSASETTGFKGYENEHVGENLQDHFVQRYEVVVPPQYNFANFYPCIMGYKFRYKDVCMGVGKMKPTGKNLFSFATAKCLQPGRLELLKPNQLSRESKHAQNRSETDDEPILTPVLEPGSLDVSLFHRQVRELSALLLEQFGIEIKLRNHCETPSHEKDGTESSSEAECDSGSFSSNWHYCGTVQLGHCVTEEFRVKGIRNLYCSDLSTLKQICSMNSQMFSYFIPYALVQRLED